MFWDWLFRKKRKDHMDNDPQMLGTRVWLQELREICGQSMYKHRTLRNTEFYLE